MIDRIRNIIRRHFDNQLTIVESNHFIYSTQKLDQLFNGEHFIPFTKWSMSPKAILHIINILEIEKPLNIIEFGSGATTIYIAQYFKLNDLDLKLTSVESNEGWIEIMQEKLNSLGLLKYVKFILAPIKEVGDDIKFKNQRSWYDSDILKEQLTTESYFDLIIVDGPPGVSSTYARYSAFPFLKNSTDENSIWLLDDTNRFAEKEIIEQWRELSDFKITHYDSYSIIMNKSRFDSEPII